MRPVAMVRSLSAGALFLEPQLTTFIGHYCRSVQGFLYGKISNVSSPFTHLGRINGTTYYYVLTALNSCGESDESDQVSAIPGKPPSKPIGVFATAGNKQ